MQVVKSFILEDDGQDVVEYGLLVATIGLVVLVGTAAFGTSVEGWFRGLSARVITTGTA